DVLPRQGCPVCLVVDLLRLLGRQAIQLRDLEGERLEVMLGHRLEDLRACFRPERHPQRGRLGDPLELPAAGGGWTYHSEIRRLGCGRGRYHRYCSSLIQARSNWAT